jgi:hypothetical protein
LAEVLERVPISEEIKAALPGELRLAAAPFELALAHETEKLAAPCTIWPSQCISTKPRLPAVAWAKDACQA